MVAISNITTDVVAAIHTVYSIVTVVVVDKLITVLTLLAKTSECMPE
jgi:hypothetical protein